MLRQKSTWTTGRAGKTHCTSSGKIHEGVLLTGQTGSAPKLCAVCFNTISCWKENNWIAWNVSVEQRQIILRVKLTLYASHRNMRCSFILITYNKRSQNIKQPIPSYSSRSGSYQVDRKNSICSLSDTQLDDKSEYSHRRLWSKVSEGQSKSLNMLTLSWTERGEETTGHLNDQMFLLSSFCFLSYICDNIWVSIQIFVSSFNERWMYMGLFYKNNGWEPQRPAHLFKQTQHWLDCFWSQIVN